MKIEEFRQIAADAIGWKGDVKDVTTFGAALLAYQQEHPGACETLCRSMAKYLDELEGY